MRLKSLDLAYMAVFDLNGLFHVQFGVAVSILSLVVSYIFIIFLLIFPQRLASFNIVLFECGLLLHRLIIYSIMCGIYFSLLVPLAFIMRASGKRFLKLGREPEAPSYWIVRTTPGPEPASLNSQF